MEFSYIVDDTLIKETPRAIGLPVCRRGESHPVSTVWFPKSYAVIERRRLHRMKVSIPGWLVAKKRETGELQKGFDILTTF